MKEKSIVTILCLLFSMAISAQSVGINTNNPDNSAILDVKSNTKGILIPRTSTISRLAILNPAKGLMLFDTTAKSFWVYNGDVWQPMLSGNDAWGTNGNTATDPTENFIGTIDNQPLRFKVNNQWGGEINPVTANTFYGQWAGNKNITGLANTAIGQNTFVNNTTGEFNTAVGINTLSNNITGNYNTAVGERVLQFNTSTHNTGIGAETLRQNTAGSNNTAAGSFALYNNTVGFFNTAVGYQALVSNNVGTTLTAIGYGADVTADFRSNATAIGAEAKVDASNKVRIGNTVVTSIGGQVGWSTFSDGRYKKEVQEDIKGLEFIIKLRPVSYVVDIPGLDNYFNKNVSLTGDSMQLHKQYTPVRRESGFIAQEVEVAVKSTGFSFSGVDAPVSPDGLYSLRYADFIVPLVKAMQEQQVIINSQQKQIDLLEKRLSALELKL